MPFGAFGFCRRRWPKNSGTVRLPGLNFLFSYPGSDGCDILQKGIIDKGTGLLELAKLAGLDLADCVAVR